MLKLNTKVQYVYRRFLKYLKNIICMILLKIINTPYDTNKK